VRAPTERKAEGDAAGERRDFVNGLAKGLAIIRAFNDHDRALTLADAAARTGLSRAAARRILMTLEDLGFTAREGERHFVLTPKVLSLGYAYLSSMPLWGFAQPVLESLVEEMRETCAIAVPDGTELVYVLRIPVHRILSEGATVGSRRPLYCHSAGRVLLAGFNPVQLDRYFERAKLNSYTDRTITEPAQLRRAIADAGRKGYAYVNGELEDNVSGVSVPIFSPEGSVLAALNVSFNRRNVLEATVLRKTLPKLRRAAERLNAALAVGPAPPRRVIRMGQAQRPR
jgi:IclR family pca regulon transcriptional regulator